MSFVLLLGGPRQNGRINRLKRAFEARGRDVCLGPPHIAEALFVSIGRTLVDHCDVVAGLELGAAPAGSVTGEVARYAQSRGKLLSIALAQDEAGEAQAGEDPTIELWPTDALQFEALCEVIEEKAQRIAATRPDADKLAYPASAEYAAHLNMRRRGDVEAIVRFLRAFPGGMFEDLVRAELDAATRPDYVPQRTHFASERDEANDPAENGWRLDGGWFERPLQWLRGQWPWLGSAAVAALLIVAVNGGFNWPSANSPNTEPRVSVALHPAAVDAAPAPGSVPSEAHRTPVSEQASPAEALAPPAPVLEAQSTEAAPEVALASAPATAALSPPSASPIVEQSPNPPSSPPIVVPAVVRVAHEIGALDADARRFVERARLSEGRARALARRQTGLPHRIASAAGVGGYQGDWTESAANGLGAVVWTNGSSYAGAWRGSRPHGFGVLVQANGQQYEGEFEAGAPNGRGVFWGADGRPLTGDRLFAALLQARAPVTR